MSNEPDKLDSAAKQKRKGSANDACEEKMSAKELDGKLLEAILLDYELDFSCLCSFLQRLNKL